MRFDLNVNGLARAIDVPPDSTLLAVLRDDLNLTATRYGCGHGACGACYVLVDGQAVASCELTVENASGKEIVTVEGLSKDGTMHPVQRAFLLEDAMQCGYCTSGMLISAAALLARNPHPGEAEMREALAPHLCRCGIYRRALRAVKRAYR